MRHLALVLIAWLGLAHNTGGSEVSLDAYERISQCVLVRERAALAGQKVQITGDFLQGSEFCHVIRKAGIDTHDYLCFALGEPCIIRLYLHKDHPQADAVRSLPNGRRVTAYGVFDYLGINYNYVILDGIVLPPEGSGKPTAE